METLVTIFIGGAATFFKGSWFRYHLIQFSKTSICFDDGYEGFLVQTMFSKSCHMKPRNANDKVFIKIFTTNNPKYIAWCFPVNFPLLI